MIRGSKHHLFFILIIGIAAALRLPHLDERPMHTDEAVHAMKFGALLEHNRYTYDPVEYHGPTLNYFTLIPAKLRNMQTLKDVDETTLRLVPVCIGLGLIPLLWGLRPALSIGTIQWAALLTALSPALVFYSRYYIQEILLVTFTFGALVCAFNWINRGKWIDALGTGCFLGLMHATKETAIIAWGAMAAAALLCALVKPTFRYGLKSLSKLQMGVLIVSAGITSALFYSSFFTHPAGIVDSFRTCGIYLDRASVSGAHHHPWFYYFATLADTEAWLLALGGIGAVWVLIQSIRKKISGFLLFWTIYTISMTVVYSLLPYKTPWSMLGFWHGWVLLAAWTITAILNRTTKPVIKMGFLIILGMGCGKLVYADLLNFGEFAYDPTNPYTYSQPQQDVVQVSNTLETVAQSQPEGLDLYVEVISPAVDYWPLPWYLRRFTSVAWRSAISPETPPAPVILVHPTMESALIEKLYTQPPPGQRPLYLPLFEKDMAMRPCVYLKGYIQKAYWDRYMEKMP